MTEYLIGVDIGTQGTKAVLFDTGMRVIASAFEASRLFRPRPGTVWQEADDLYGAAARTIAELMTHTANPAAVLAVGVDSQMAGIMGVGADGEAVTCYDSWLDTRCGGYMEEMRARCGKRVIEITGGPVTYTHGPKILWWKGEHPDIYRKISKFVLPHGYVVGKMTGLSGAEAYFDYTGLQYSGFGDNRNKEWSGELLEAFGVDPDKMARIVSPFSIAGHVTPDFAKLSGLAPGTPVAAGAGDTAASVFGSGMFGGDFLLDCAGTASVLCGAADSYAPDTAYETMTMMRAPIDNLWYPLAYINGGGLCVRWLRDELTGKPHASYETLEAEAQSLEPGSRGLLFVPHFAGRVLPADPSMRGAFIGLDGKHTRAHLFRAVMEGIAYEYGYYLSVLKKLYPKNRFTRMRAVGGGAKSELFLRIKADILGVDVSAFDTGDTAPIGSAVIAGVAAGVFSDYRTPVAGAMRERMTLAWDRARHELYRPYQSTYGETLTALSAVYQTGAVYAPGNNGERFA